MPIAVEPARTAAAEDTYMDLVRRFPLKTIKDDAGHAGAVAVVSGLIGRDLDAGAGDYLDALLVLVNKYEDEHHTPGGDLSPAAALDALMSFNGLTAGDVARLIGSDEATVAGFLAGTGDLTTAHLAVLADRFRVEPETFWGRRSRAV